MGWYVLVGLAIAAGALFGRWLVVPVAAASWVGLVLGVKAGRWGNGVGDGWQYGLALGSIATAVGTTAGVLSHRLLRRVRRAA